MGFHFFELKKLPDDINEKDTMLLWLSLFKANTEEELEKIRELEVPEMEQAINAYYAITTSSEFREIERLRAKARHDEAQALYHVEQRRNTEIALDMIAEGEPIDKIMRYSHLSKEDIVKLTDLPQEDKESLRANI